MKTKTAERTAQQVIKEAVEIQIKKTAERMELKRRGLIAQVSPEPSSGSKKTPLNTRPPRQFNNLPFEVSEEDLAAARERLDAQYQDGPKVVADSNVESACPNCGGLGVVRRNADAKPGENDFGKADRCPNTGFHNQARLKTLSKISNLSVSELEIRLSDIMPYHRPEKQCQTKIMGDDGQPLIVTSSNMEMVEVFGRLAKDPFCDKGMIFLLGEWGCGKTYAAMALVNEINLRDKGPAMYITLPDLIGFLVSAYDERNRKDKDFGDWSFERRYRAIAEAKVLMVDEFDFQDSKVRDTDHNLQLLQRWFNERYRSGIHNQTLTIVISNNPIDSMGLGAVSSRGNDGRFRTIINTAPDMRPGEGI